MSVPARSFHPWSHLTLLDHLSHHRQRLFVYAEMIGDPEGRMNEVLPALLDEEATRAGLIEHLVQP